MSSALSVSAPSPRSPDQTPGTRGFARQGSDAPASGTPAFDALLADHAATPQMLKADTRPDQQAHRPSGQRDGSAERSDEGARAGSGMKRSLTHGVGRDDETAHTPDDAASAAGPADPADPASAVAAVAAVAAAATAPPMVVAPTSPGPGAVPVLTTLDPSLNAPIAPTPEGPTAPGLGVVPVASTPAPHPTPGTGSTSTAADPATAAALTPTSGSVSGDTGASSASSGKGAVLPGATGHAAPKAEVQVPVETVHPTASGQPLDALKAATTQAHQGTDGTRPDGSPSAAAGVVPVLYTPVSPTTAPTASSQPATGPQGSLLPEAVHQQVYTAVAPLLRGSDGSYGIQLNLHPRDLGAVQVSVDMRHGQIAIQMHATDPAAREALRDGLSDLRQQLEDQGLRTGSMEVGSGGADARQPEMSQSRSRGIELPNHTRDPSEPLVATAVAASTTALDLRM